MKHVTAILILCAVLAPLSGCSRPYDPDAVLQKYGDNPLLQSALDYEKRIGLTEADHEDYALRCMLFANMTEELDATLFMKDKLKKVHKTFPDNAPILSYYAATVGMAGRDNENVTNKMVYAKRSINYLDRAVSMDGENPVIRLSRGHMSYSMPAMLDRGDTAREDYDFLISCLSDGSCSLPAEEAAAV
ncbi:MAG: hypothetical protein ACOCWH_02285, partial [Spirochaetota bacterium]